MLEGCVDAGWIGPDEMTSVALMVVAQVIADAPISAEQREATIATVRENLSGMVALARGESAGELVIGQAAGQRLQ